MWRSAPKLLLCILYPSCLHHINHRIWVTSISEMETKTNQNWILLVLLHAYVRFLQACLCGFLGASSHEFLQASFVGFSRSKSLWISRIWWISRSKCSYKKNYDLWQSEGHYTSSALMCCWIQSTQTWQMNDNCFKNSKWMMMHVTNQRVLCFSSSSSWGEEERDDAKLHSQSRFHCLLNYTYVPLSTTAIWKSPVQG